MTTKPTSEQIRSADCDQRGTLQQVWAAMRPVQWTKNGVVLAAYIFALGDQGVVVGGADLVAISVAALCFCLLSSAVYLLNDVRDREEDRQHPVKRLRPIASGQLAPEPALLAAGVLAVVAFGGAALVTPPLLGVLVAYAVIQMIYTLGLKRVALLDVFVIAAGFVLRALAGAVAIAVPISPWLLLCTLLLALFLALCKRRHERVVLNASAEASRTSMRGYDVLLLDQLIAIVAAATVVCYALYTLWPETVEKFGTHGLGFTIPFVLFGLFRYLDLVYRHDQGGQPERILVTDKPLLVDLLGYGLTVVIVLLLR